MFLDSGSKLARMLNLYQGPLLYLYSVNSNFLKGDPLLNKEELKLYMQNIPSWDEKDSYLNFSRLIASNSGSAKLDMSNG